MRNPNCPHKKERAGSHGMCRNCYNKIRYQFDSEFREKARERAKKYAKQYYKDPEFRKRKSQREKEFRKRNPLKYRKKIALCNIRYVLRHGRDREFIRQIRDLID